MLYVEQHFAHWPLLQPFKGLRQLLEWKYAVHHCPRPRPLALAQDLLAGAGIDLALALVEEDLGHSVAANLRGKWPISQAFVTSRRRAGPAFSRCR